MTLTNQLSPLPNVGMQSLTENVPANWTATNISDFGTFEAGSGTIRWMFFDNQARPLRFTLLAPASASGAVALHGIASFDGQEAAVGGLAELVPPPPPAGTVVRHLPDTYRADTGFTVTLTVTPEAGIEFYTVAETVPSGWAVTTISNYGSFADGTIRWGPFTDAEARTLAYIVQAPVGAGSNAVFAGAGFFGAISVPTSGDPNVAPAPLAGGSAGRDLPVNFRPGTPFTAAIAVAPYSNTLFWVVAETLPTGWAVSNLSHGGVFSAARQQIQWGPYLDSTPRTLTCDLISPGNATGAVVFSGQAQFDTVSVEIAGDTQTIARLPGGGTVARTLPQYYLPQQTLGVSLTVTPDDSVSAQGIEDLYPAGWVVDPASVSDNGLVRTAESKVRWLLLDATPRVLTYTITPASNAVGEACFGGQGTFDALAVTIGGSTNLLRKPGGTATRALPGFFVPGLSVPVELNISVDTNVVFVTVVDTPPAGWPVDSISQGGSFNPTTGTVSWILSAGVSSNRLTYRVWSPLWTTNTVPFAGTISCDGLAAPVAGNTNLRPNLMVMVCASNKPVEFGSAWSFDPPGVADDCRETNITVSIVGTVTNGVRPLLVTRMWVAVDGCGNSNTCSQVVTIQDTTAPLITLNGANPTTNECHAAFADPGATALDTWDGSVAVSANSTVNANAVGLYTVTYTATDTSGNGVTNTRVVYVRDTTAPVITLAGPNPMTNECYTAFVDPGATVSDACAGSVPGTTTSTVNPNAVGVYTVTYTASDPSGNSATNTRTVYIRPFTATLTLNNLSQTYNGVARSVTTATAPLVLPVNVTYNGSASAPTNAGSYTVIGTINAANYEGASTNTLVVNPAAATVTLGNLSQTCNGSVRAAAVSTIPAGLGLNVTYNGAVTAPVNAGRYTVVALLSSPNYTGGATNTLVVGKASQTINLALAVTGSIPLNQITNPIAVLATASSGLPVTLRLGSNSAAVLTETNTLVAIQSAGSITILANQAGNDNYYAAAEEVLTLEVALVPQTITFAPIPDVPATHGPLALNATASSGLAVLYSVVSGPAAVSGNQLTVTGAGLVTVAADQPGNVSYNAAETVKQRFNATLVAQTITFGSLPPRNYGNATFTLSATASSGLPVSYTSSDSAVVSVSGSTVTITGAGTATLTASQAGNAYYEAAANVSQPLIVNPVSATVALGNLNQRYTGTARSVTATPTPAGLAVSVTYDGWPSAPTNAGSYTVVATITAANYSGRATNTLVVSAPLATVTLGNLSQTYNGAARTVSVSTIPADLSLAVTYNGLATAPTNVGRYTVVALVTSPNYTGGATNTLVVGQASQTINLALAVTNSIPIPLNQLTYPVPVMATASSGLPVTLTLAAGSVATLTETNTLVDIKTNGTITILANQAGNGNYQAAAEELTLYVALAPQTLTFEPIPDVPATHGPIALNATASSGLAVIFSVISGPATITNNVLTPTGSGLVTVAANQPGSTNAVGSIFAKGGGLGYNPAAPVFQSFYVTLVPQAITFGPLSARAYGSGTFALLATASSGLPVSYVSSDPGVATLSGSTVTLVGAGTATLTASQAGDGVYDPATNVSQTLTINPGAATVALGSLIQGYNGTARSVTATPTPAGLAVSVTYDGWPSAPTNAGSYTVVASITDPNYRGSSSAASRITPKPLTVTAPAIAARGYDATTTAGAVTVGAVSGFVGSEYASVTGVAADYASASVGTYPGVEISYTLHDGTGGGWAGNYSLANGTATGRITPRALTVVGILASDKVYDGRTNATLILTQAALAGNLDGIHVVLSTTSATGAFADPHVGINQPVQVAGLTLSGSATNNYTFSQPTTRATITGKRLTITANADAKTYGTVKTYGSGRMAFGTDAGDLVSGDDVTSVTLACADGGPATAVVGSYAITPSAAVGIGLENYLIRYQVGVLTVGARGLNVTAEADAKTYGTAKPYGPGQTTFSTGAGELVNGDRVSSVTLASSAGGPVTAVVGSYHIVSSAAVGTGLGNYAIQYHDGALTVNPRTLNITANGDSKTYGAVKTYGPGQTAFGTGAGELVNGDSVTNVTLACLDGGPATAAAGNYDLIASAAVGSGLGNYSLSYHAGTLRVLAANSALALVSSENPSVHGSNVTFTATVTPVAPATTTPGGSVQFYLNGTVSGSPVPLSGGEAGIIAAFYKLGTNLVAATYLPDGNYVESEASLEQLVQATPQTPFTTGIKNNGNGTVTVSFSGTPNAGYVVQASARLMAPLWQNVSTNVAGADGRWTFEDSTRRDAQRFYRAVRP